MPKNEKTKESGKSNWLGSDPSDKHGDRGVLPNGSNYYVNERGERTYDHYGTRADEIARSQKE